MKQDKLSNGMERTTYEQKDYEQKGPVATIGYEDLWARADKPYSSPVGPADGPREPAGASSGGAQIAGYGHSGPLVERVERVIGQGLGGAKRVGTGIPDGHDTEMAKVQADPTSKRETIVPAEGDKRQTGGKRASLGASIHQLQLAVLNAEYRHGHLTKNYERVIVLMTEELGEVAECVATWTRADGNPNKRPITYGEIIEEVAQLGALCIMFIENLILEEEEKKQWVSQSQSK